MFGNEIKFKYNWRSYQGRVLNEIEKHLQDNKLHVIAPPGSGKTVLGLEVVRKLNKPTLILSPTITIRNQWIDRFVNLFSNGQYFDYSHSLANPCFLTSSTYQSLHSAFTRNVQREQETDDDITADTEPDETGFDLVKTLKEHEIKVLVLDEAHHLKTAWWKSLISVVRQLEGITIISLTATPPYDSTRLEWERYTALCGPIDEEITVPELVKEKNLCPHQDLIYYSGPTTDERLQLDEFYYKTNELKQRLIHSETFEEILSRNRGVVNPEECREEIFNDVEYYASIIVFLHYKQNESYKALQHVLGLESKNIPEISDEWFEYLLSYALFKDESITEIDEIKQIRKELKESGAIEKKKVILCKKEKFNKLMSSSLSKFESIRDIIDHEYKGMGEGLRLVVLTDYVRKEVLNDKVQINKFGVIPIFKYLYKTNSESEFDYSDKMAVLSGTICIIPDSAIENFVQMAIKYKLSKKEIKFQSVQDNYSEVLLSTSKKNLTVNIVTDLFTDGKINIIIGTKSLLGEGWDCQAINSLIMATFVGSYMLSNQMRGRAIRTDHTNPHKTSNIWHLMCLDNINIKNNYDFEILSQRFKCFTGLDSNEDIITNGIERLQLPDFKRKKISIDELNENVKKNAFDRARLYERWFNSINRFNNGKIVKEIKSHKKVIKRDFIFARSIKYLFLESVASGGIYGVNFIIKALRSLTGSDPVSFKYISLLLTFALAVVFVTSLPPTIVSIILLIKHGPVSGSFKQISLAVVDTMKQLNMFETPEDVVVETEADPFGVITSRIQNCSPYEQSVFLTALQEIVGPVRNPRYLVTREQRFLINTSDHHSIPSIFGDKKERAEIFFNSWKKHMGKSKMFYTRNQAGRKELVKARSNSLSSSFLDESEIVDSWKC